MKMEVCFTKDSSITFSMVLCWLNIVGNTWGCVQQSALPCTHKKRVSASPILNMCSFNLLLLVITLIHVVSCDLFLTPEFRPLAGTDRHMVWSGLLLSGRLQVRCHFFMVDFLILFFTMEIDVGLTPSFMASGATSLAYPSANSFAARAAFPGTQWILMTIFLLASALMLAMHWSMVSWWDLSCLLEVTLVITAWQLVKIVDCDMMCAAVFVAELSCQQHSPQLSVIGGTEISNGSENVHMHTSVTILLDLANSIV